ncbi:hypothetical protein DVQ44_03455 [Yersinia enterocolitica]|jgi:hypothetical protein|uniref:DUF6527 family protein n=1 Tax=Yersinia intermedia TaxID=631 RepID=UPI002A51AD6F|nr:hypothetical protein [Yersinia enterocolitica]EKN6247058.1 hypothetical protein [Yersinia enterocolitica]EKN6277393.1 hypothetical protein [Yersinia enterocolitica]
MKLSQIKLMHVDTMPKILENGILYYSDKYGTAAHICACGCGQKIRTPIGPTEWSLTESSQGPTLNPSVGNWQKECKSHYFIRKGKIEWCGRWTEEQINKGREREELARAEYYNSMYANKGFFERLWLWIKSKLGM